MVGFVVWSLSSSSSATESTQCKGPSHIWDFKTQPAALPRNLPHQHLLSCCSIFLFSTSHRCLILADVGDWTVTGLAWLLWLLRQHMLEVPVISGTALSGMLRIYSISRKIRRNQKPSVASRVLLPVYPLALVSLDMEIHIPSQESVE